MIGGSGWPLGPGQRLPAAGRAAAPRPARGASLATDRARPPADRLATNPRRPAQVRNHILAVWRYDVSRYLSAEEAATRIRPRLRHLVQPAWQWLDREGHINWCVAPGILRQPAASSGQRETVVVILSLIHI